MMRHQPLAPLDSACPDEVGAGADLARVVVTLLTLLHTMQMYENSGLSR